MKRRVCMILLAAALLFLAACGETPPVQKELFAMDTVLSLKVWGDEAALNAVSDELLRLDAMLDATDAASEIGRLNAGETITGEAAALVSAAVEFSRKTGGAFDPTVYPFMRLWGFTDETQHVPERAEIEAALTQVGVEQVLLSDDTASLRSGAAVDLGGIAKGYAAEQCAAVLEQSGATAALLSLGGNIQTYGTKPDGSAWMIGIADPQQPEQAVASVAVTGTKALVTSGGYQRNFEAGGVRYHHILDPKSGYPAESGLTSVTIIADSGTLADAYSTALFVMGLEKATEFWRREQSFAAVFITTDGVIYATDGVSLSGCDYQVIER